MAKQKPEHEKRNVRIEALLKKEEKKLLLDDAERLGLNVSSYIRMILFAKVKELKQENKK